MTFAGVKANFDKLNFKAKNEALQKLIQKVVNYNKYNNKQIKIRKCTFLYELLQNLIFIACKLNLQIFLTPSKTVKIF